MTFQRIVEMAIKPPFKYYVVRDGYFGNAVADRFCYNSISKAKECAEAFLLPGMPFPLAMPIFVSSLVLTQYM